MNPQKTFENLPDEKRQRILSEATREFADHGYHQASINTIVNKLGIAKGSLFKYFGNKQGLFEYLFGDAISQFKQPLKAIRDTDSGDFFQRIEKSFLASGAFTQSHPHLYRIYLKMLFNENFPLREKFLTEIRRAHDKFLRQLVEDGIASGQLRKDLDIDITVFTIHSIFDRFLQSHTVPTLDHGVGPSGQSLEDLAQAMTDLLRHGLTESPN
ncbi:TetR/AcrR family transcriptional regulator [Pseudodesulfovibrio piezophilus]|uniref:Transcriptional regulator, TetR family n=1 Tax=Pseudodesulfovibrio piezophilus (strain DSM 21447 / JCM 15486 / C1TLV30) TaxID=1322246 RepID=M1WL16_PSEP2|nr:TetR/AcrR family transcriptional regulator [Pseudodesulfovibrio piezophilus]CCH50561.1 Transcriptional regulator, TetR family [Pseudodesulfovibrio piezophilus C1TLV30]